MPYMQDIVKHFKPKGVKVIIGGAPVTQGYADQIGADGFGEDASSAVKLVDKLLGKAA
jgi:5-methyltetrahydrofolate--homocysteine methyltransferase